MSRNPTAATTNFANGANGISVGRDVDPAGAAGGGAENATMQGLTPFLTHDSELPDGPAVGGFDRGRSAMFGGDENEG